MTLHYSRSLDINQNDQKRVTYDLQSWNVRKVSFSGKKGITFIFMLNFLGLRAFLKFINIFIYIFYSVILNNLPKILNTNLAFKCKNEKFSNCLVTVTFEWNYLIHLRICYECRLFECRLLVSNFWINYDLYRILSSCVTCEERISSWLAGFPSAESILYYYLLDFYFWIRTHHKCWFFVISKVVGNLFRLSLERTTDFA